MKSDHDGDGDADDGLGQSNSNPGEVVAVGLVGTCDAAS